MGAQGTATLSFGAFPGKTDTFVAVTGQTGFVAATSLCEAWAYGSTADHSSDEHWVENLIVATQPFVDTAFIIFGRTGDKLRLYGDWKVAWVWN
jgi:hypothetical protein